MRIHTITPQNAFIELQQSSLRTNRTSRRCMRSSSLTQTIQNCTWNLFPFQKRGLFKCPLGSLATMQAPASPVLQATLDAGSPTMLKEAAARSLQSFISLQPKRRHVPLPYFT